jgi:betaine-aldehyde dehydrogenase
MVYERQHFYIGGEWVEPLGDQISDVISPSTEEIVARAPSGSIADIDRAVEAARDAFDNGPWRKMSWQERIAIMSQVLKALNERGAEIAEASSIQAGRDRTVNASGARNPYQILFEHYLETAETLPLWEIRQGPANPALILREPAGVVAAITPFNAPLACAINKSIPALIAGCTVVVKPPPETPLDTYALAEAIHEVGLPAGVFNMVAAGREEGAHLVEHPGVDIVHFTGSVPAGKAIGEACARQVKRACLELGGKSAGIVLEDADLEKAACSAASARRASRSPASSPRARATRRSCRRSPTRPTSSPARSVRSHRPPPSPASRATSSSARTKAGVSSPAATAARGPATSSSPPCSPTSTTPCASPARRSSVPSCA